MDKNHVKSLLSNLNSSSTTKIIDSLHQIRTRVIKTDQGLKTFRECGGLENLTPLLRKTNENVLDIVLSILGNCCMDEGCSLRVGKLKISSHLIFILKCISRDSIVGRTCRVIGNLAQQAPNAEQLHSEGAVAALVTVIANNEKTSTFQTLQMAVRAIRLLWMVTERREDMISSGVVRAVAVLLSTECENAELIKPLSGEAKTQTKEVTVRKSRDELFAGLLKCLGFFTMLSTFQCAEQILGDGRGYRCLVVLSKDFTNSAVKCILNLCYVSTSRPNLGTAGAVECMVDLLNSRTDDWPESWVRTLCLLSREAVNRAKLRECGGLTLLLAVARDTGDVARHSHALNALLQFVFDCTGFQILINEGLIEIIEIQLKEYVATMKCEHQQKITEDLSNTDAPQDENDTKDCKKSTSAKTIEPASNCASIKISNGEEKCKISIESDNMIIGFNDTYDASDCEGSEEEYKVKSPGSARKRSKKFPAADLPKNLSLQKMARYDWSSNGISCEPKGPPDWSYSNQSPNLSPNSGYSPTSNYSKSPKYESRLEQRGRSNSFKYHGMNSGRRGMDSGNDWSPESTGSTGGDGGCSSSTYYSQWSPSSPQSLCYSPQSITNCDEESSSDSEKSGRYSPVCSDVEECPMAQFGGNAFQFPDENMSEFSESQMANDLDDLMMDDETYSVQDLQLEDTTEQQSRSHKARCLLVLLSRVFHSDTGVERLGSKDLLLSLISYVQKSRFPLNRAARILAKIISNAKYLVRLLKHRLILHLYKMLHEPKHTECQQCKQLNTLATRLLTQLTMLAESDYGIGEISYRLLKGQAPMKQTLALTLPYIIRSQRPLKKFLITLQALELFFLFLMDYTEPLEYCIPSLSQLAFSLNLKDPKTLENKFKDHIILGYDPAFEGVEPEDIVNLLLDDSSSVQANKQFLCQQSEVFNAMFTGSFKESSEKSVRLKKVTKDGLEYLLTLLHCGINNESASVETFPLPTRLATALETLLLADRFLMEKLKGLLFSAIVQFKLEPSSADEIYVWSLEEGMGLLCVESVAYMLAGQMDDKQRLKLFSSIMMTNYKQQLIDDVRNILIRHFN